MGNNFFIPVLGQGTAIISLNGQRVLICNVLHVPGLLVPLHSLCVHLTQCGCTSAIWLFWAAAGSLMRCFYCNCGHKLFGTAISKYLIDNQSKIAAAPAKWQSSNGLVKSHWKTMVHMARAYLTEKQMSWTFCFYAVVHLAQMMNAIPGTYLGHLTSPFLLVHSVGHNELTWIPLFSLYYFHHKKDSDQQRSHHQAHTMEGILSSQLPC